MIAGARWRTCVMALIGASTVLVSPTVTRGALAVPPPPAELEVQEGSGWLPEREFGLRWRNPTPAGQPVGAVRYLLRNPLDATVIGPVRIDHPVESVSFLRFQGGPGSYRAEVWLEDTLGLQGPAASTRVQFDDTRPGGVQPLLDPGWIGRAELPYALHLSHPHGEAPPAGIRGYAVSINTRDDRDPCARPDLCRDNEIDLRGGPDDSTLLIPELPQGNTHIRTVAVTGSGMHSATSGHGLLRVDRVDPVTEIAGLPDGWVNRVVVVRATARDDASGMEAADGAFTAVRVDAGTPSISPGDSEATAIAEEGNHRIAYYARDGAGNVNDGRSSNGSVNPEPRFAAVRIDRTPPFAVLVGSVGPKDPELIEARVADALSGPSGSRGSISVRPRGSSREFERLPTTFSGEVLRARWKTDEYPPGEYEFRVVGYDAAGNSAASARKTNGSPLVLPNPLKIGTHLLANFAGAQQIETVNAGADMTLTGVLALSSGEVAAGEAIDVLERFAPGADEGERRTEVRTDSSGRFGLRLPPGPSREVLVRFAGNHFATAASADPLRLETRPRAALRASAKVAVVGGVPVTFSGGLDGVSRRQVPPDGIAVRLQFRIPGMRWREFRTLRSDRRGRFRYRYPFSDDDSRGARFEFRAVIPTQGDWPFAPTTSRPIALRGV